MSSLRCETCKSPVVDLAGACPSCGAPIHVSIAHYEVIARLGQGGMGVVYRARDTSLGRMVALKVLAPKLAESPAARARFLREARSASALDHPNIATIHEAGEHAGLLYLVMALIEGETLAERISRGPIPREEAIDVLTQLLDGLGAAHAAGIVHRDIKPANVMITRQGRVKILDFGLAKLARGAVQKDMITTGGELLGTFQYMAPEQLQGEAADARADLWAVGVVAYEMLAGEHPFEPDSDADSDSDPDRSPEGQLSPTVPVGSAATIARIVAADPAPLAERLGDAPDALSEAVMKLLAKRPARRFQSAAEAAAAITGAPPPIVETVAERSSSPGKSSAPPAALEPPPAPPPAAGSDPSRSRRRAIGWGALAAFLAANIAGALFVVKPWMRRRHTAIDAEILASFAPLPSAISGHEGAFSEQTIELGKNLFSDPILSKNGDIACTTCHPLDRYGADGKRFSRGSDGREPPRNTLSIYNVSGFFALLWDGRQDNLVSQAKEVLCSPRAMAAPKDRLPETLKAVPAYARAFSRAFPDDPDPVSFENTARALAAYESNLFTRGRWDRFLEGDQTTLSDEEKAGFNRFVEVGCIACHFGPNVGATMFQKAGLVKAWPDTRDKGRYEITKRDVDRMVFRVPSLRNVAMTAPYFHDGSVDTLSVAIRMMARHQIGRELDDEDVTLIESWLKSLTGDLPPR